ncbi:protein lin-28 homolog A-like [Pongo abelii]|uniref:protein lin-28 homolog A-like n=1 Tax=Pongo abelii TaxID=9601 RepID=UPI0023E8CBED|nr:protein lin-28 homolog A-like [Pongo abelii]
MPFPFLSGLQIFTHHLKECELRENICCALWNMVNTGYILNNQDSSKFRCWPSEFSGTSSCLTRRPGPRAQPTTIGSVSTQQFAGGCAEEAPEDAARAADKAQLLHGEGICKWFNLFMGFGLLYVTACTVVALDTPVDVFVHQSKLHMEDFRSLKEGEAVEFTFKKSAKGLESIRVTGPGGAFRIGSERWPKGKNMQKRRSKDRCYNCGGLDHHAKECKLCHFCQSISHMVASCPLKAQQGPSAQGKPTYFREEEEEIHSPALLPEAQN